MSVRNQKHLQKYGQSIISPEKLVFGDGLKYSEFLPNLLEYYESVNQDKMNGKQMLKAYSRFDSIYNQNISNSVLGHMYQGPEKGVIKFKEYEYKHNPQVLKFSKIGLKAFNTNPSSPIVTPNKKSKRTNSVF